MALRFLRYYCAPVALFSVFLSAEADFICTCPIRTICDHFEYSSVVLHGTVLSRTPGTISLVTSSFDDLEEYTVDVTTFYKADPALALVQQVEFVTGGIPYSCAVSLAVGEEYLIGLYWDSDGHLRANSCGLYRPWDAVTPANVAALAGGCIDESLCGGCGEFQVCLVYETEADLCPECPLVGPEFYCADFCDAGRCSRGETCSLQDDDDCVQDPCPPVAVCE